MNSYISNFEMRKHVIYICAIAILLLAIFAGFNWIIDPYKIWDVPVIRGVNTSRGLVQTHERIFKSVGLSRRQASVAILGTSRSDLGLDPNHAALGPDALNMAISGQPYRETRMLFDLLADRGTLRAAVIGLDFFEANVFLGYPSDFVEENFLGYRDTQLKFSGSTLVDSISTLIDSVPTLSQPALASGNETVLATGFWAGKGLNQLPDAKSLGGNRKLMADSEKFFLSTFYLPSPTCLFDFESQGDKISPLEEIRAVISRAHKEHIALKLLISPSHARQWETLGAAGLWGKWEEWKRRLVSINEEEGRVSGQPAFPLWDFSGYHTISSESVPRLGDTEKIMHWYFDSSHYTAATGNLVLDRIFDYRSSKRTIPDDFGVLLSSHNIGAHLAHIRLAREHYRVTHPDDVSEIEAMARDVAKTKHCRIQS